ncbi:PGF-pre-PGF domain-containing protein [uncultured Methanomethylovorans sp.]|uniref:PGF-pre-PGF domain-containing protein n=1 Tax=uncultured Methanomethylovorans sp. TaxID=183759 RepID=UPI002AA9304E|nr:PGF-pre-PGF domain-containing protein [uncultured Methanomethylovorans sp.]
MRIKLSGLIYSVLWLVYFGIILFLVVMNAEPGLADNVTVDKSGLISVITSASLISQSAVAGTEPGQYPQSAIDAFDEAIDISQAVVDDASATQVEVNQAVKDLKAAETIFDAAKIKVVDHTPPSTVKDLRESSSGTSWIRWTWNNPDDKDFSHVLVYLDGVFIRTTSNAFYNATGLAAGTLHTISIETVDATGNINPALVSDSATTKIPVDIVPPSPVTGLKESSTGLDWIRWTWTNPIDADFEHVMVYFDGIFVTTTSDAFYNAVGLLEGTTHTITVKTVDTSGNINPTTVSDQATTKVTDRTPPGPVTNLHETNVGASWIYWTWTKPADTDFSNVRIYIDGTFIATTSSNYYNATGLRNGIKYAISIETVDTSGNINSSQVTDSAITLKLPVISNVVGKSIKSTSITLEWDASEDTSIVQISQDGIFLDNATESTYVHRDLNSSTTYNYTLIPYNENGLEGKAVSISLTTSSSTSGGGSSGGSSSKKSSSSSSGGGGAASSVEDFTNVAMKDVDSKYLRINSNVTYEFTKAGNDVQSVSFYSLKNSGEIISTIEVLNNRSKLVNTNPEGFVYKYVNIWVGKAGFAISDNIKDPRIKFQVNNSWIKEMEISPADVKLQRYNGTSWQVLPTIIDSNTTGYSVFEADAPGFSPFAITAERPLPSIPNSDVEVLTANVADVGLEKIRPKKSGMWTIIIAFILAGVLAVGYEYLRKE